MTDQPAECAPACSEQHTYQLSTCALACTERYGGVADPSWAVPCPKCKATADRPCIRWDGSAASVACQKRWDLFDQRALEARQAPATVEPSRPDAKTTLRQQALEAAHATIRDGRWWLPPAGQVEVVDAVLEVIAARDGAPTQAAMAADAFEIPLRLINTTQPAEHCGNQLPPLLGDGPVTECVLRPGHQGSHANHDGARWIATPGADDDLEAARRRAVAFQARIDAARAWARQHLEPEQQAGLLAVLRGDQPEQDPEPIVAVPDSVLHAQFRHPDWEYATTEGPRKQWYDIDVPPCDGNGDPDPTWERNTDAGRMGWERFDYTEESYWRRRKTQLPGSDRPTLG